MKSNVSINKSFIFRLLIIIFITIFLFLILQFLDKRPSNYFSTTYSDNIFALRETLLDILFRVAPFFVTIIIAISSLTINSYTGTLFREILEDRLIRNFLFLIIGTTTFHLLVVSETKNAVSNSLNNFSLYVADLLSISFLLLFACYVCYHIFLYNWPGTLRKRFVEKIKKVIKDLQDIIQHRESNNSAESEIEGLQSQLSQNIRWFINLLLKAINTKDYDTIIDILEDISKIRLDSVTYSEDEKESPKKLIDNLILKYDDVDKIIEQLMLRDQEILKVHKNLVQEINNVYIESFETGILKKEYYICDLIIEKLHYIAINKIRSSEDIEIIFTIYYQLFEKCISANDTLKTPIYCEKIIGKINDIYSNHDLKDYDIYIKLIDLIILSNEVKLLKDSLTRFRQIFNEKIDESIYRHTIVNLHKSMLDCLRKKRMSCFSHLVRFTVISDLNLEIINDVFSSIISPNIDFQNFLESIDLNYFERKDDYRTESYLRLKLYIIWYCYYLLQKKISPDRIINKYSNLPVHKNSRRKIPYYLVRTVILDLETHLGKWNALYVQQARVYFLEIALEIVEMNTRDRLVIIEDNFESQLLKQLKRRLYRH